MNEAAPPIDRGLPELMFDEGETLHLAEIPWSVSEEIASWGRILDNTTGDKRQNFAQACRELTSLARTLPEQLDTRHAIIDALFVMARNAEIDDDEAQALMAGQQQPSDLGHQTNGLAHEIEMAPPPAGPDDYGPPVATIDERPSVPAAVLIGPTQWPQEAPPPVDWLVAGRIPRGDVTTLHGDGGAGKTDIALRLAANVARGAPEWLGHEITSGPVVLLSAEEPEREIRRRLWMHAEHDGYGFADLSELHQWFPGDDHDTIFGAPDRTSGVMRSTQLLQSITAAIEQAAPVLIIVDNVAATFAGNQNDRVMVRSFVNLWRAIARGPSRPAVLLLDHPSLSGLTSNSGRGGNMDWRNSVRSALYLKPSPDQAEADRGVRILETTKSNYGPSGQPLRLLWAEGGLQLEHQPSSLHRLAKEQECDDTFLRLMDDRNAQGRFVSDKKSRNYAPTVFAEIQGGRGFTTQAFAKSMERLFQARKIALRAVRIDGKSRDVIDHAESK
ncbi:MAG TPA: AAA family ATPase [Xanthobacteraceae bacterium]|jgi:RecA-family ATPase|nr:AAA family ATPase [Xanthobacteraceae bacterium]